MNEARTIKYQQGYASAQYCKNMKDATQALFFRGLPKIGFLALALLRSLEVAHASGSWLAEEPTRIESAELAGFLNSLGGSCRALACAYHGNKLVTARPFVAGKAEIAGAQWNCELRVAKAGDGILDVAATFKVVNGTATQAGVAVAFDFSHWTTNNFVLVPAVLYDGNRFRVLPIGYAPYIHNEKDRPLDMPVTVTDIMRLNPDGARAQVEMMTGNCATPMLSFFAPATKHGFALLTEQQSRFGNNGLFVEEDAKHSKKMTFAVSAPCVRERKYRMCGFMPSPDRATDWKTGDELTLRFKLMNFPCEDLAAFFDRVFSARKALTGANTYRQVAPYSHISELIVNHFNKDKWFQNEQYGYYCNSRDNANPYNNQIGWSGNPVYSFPNGLAGDLKRVASTLDMLTQAQGRSGLFYAMFQKGTIHGDTFDENPATRAVAMGRRTGETLHFGLKQLEAFKARGQPIKPEWETMFRRAANALVKLFGDYGQFGQFVDADTGKMVINGSTAGGVNITGLAVASQYFHEPKYLDVAEKAGRFYAERDLAKGYAGGGPSEILQAPDVESSHNLVEAYVTLHDIARQPEWLAYARQAAALLSTWMVSYDYRFPKDSDHNRVGNRVTGAIFASSQNNHAAPGFYITSGNFLLRLYRATGDKRVAELYKDYAHNVIQYVNTKTNPLMPDGGSHEGRVTERVQLSDWESHADPRWRPGIGQVSLDSNMAWETQVAVTCLENPGIYVNTETGDLIVPDHVDATVENRDESGVTLKITNPTPYDANISILAETSVQAKKPLSRTACLTWPKVEVKKGDTKIVRAALTGALK
jgi:hypothetical protein